MPYGNCVVVNVAPHRTIVGLERGRLTLTFGRTLMADIPGDIGCEETSRGDENAPEYIVFISRWQL